MYSSFLIFYVRRLFKKVNPLVTIRDYWNQLCGQFLNYIYNILHWLWWIFLKRDLFLQTEHNTKKNIYEHRMQVTLYSCFFNKKNFKVICGKSNVILSQSIFLWMNEFDRLISFLWHSNKIQFKHQTKQFPQAPFNPKKNVIETKNIYPFFRFPFHRIYYRSVVMLKKNLNTDWEYIYIILSFDIEIKWLKCVLTVK